MANERIGIRSGTNAQWLAANTTPGTEYEIKNREMIYVSDLRQIKIGDGSSNYSALPFIQVDHQQVVGLGTASTRDVTTSATDTTADRVLTTRSYGLGRGVNYAGDLDDLKTPGVYVAGGSATNKPDSSTYIVQVFAPVGVTSQVRQVAYRFDSVRQFVRNFNVGSGVWLAWQELHHTGNLPVIENASWTPTLFGSTTAGDYTLTLTNRYYSKIGKTVFLHAAFTVDTIVTAGEGSLRIGGLPVPYREGSAIMGNISTQNLNYLDTVLSLNLRQSTSSAGDNFVIAGERRDSVRHIVPITTVAVGAIFELSLQYTEA